MHTTDIAAEAVGNWKKFNSFAWHNAPDDPDAWCIVYTRDRDSGLRDQSNHAAITAELEPFPGPDLRQEHHGHWGCGWKDGFAIRVFDANGDVTPGFTQWAGLTAALADTAVLDNEDYSHREREATVESISWEGRNLTSDAAPDDWAHQVHDWLFDHDQDALDNLDDRGGYPSQEQIGAGLIALGWLTEG